MRLIHLMSNRGTREKQGNERATFVSIDAPAMPQDGLRFFFGWKPGAPSSDPDVGICPHAGGPPRCWCRPPLPGLLVAWARKHDVDLSRSTVIGTSPAHRTMAKAIGAGCHLVTSDGGGARRSG